MRTFFYNVNGTEFVDTEAFGVAWMDAKVLAKKENTYITRTVISDNGKVRYEFFAKGGCFLNEKNFSKENAFIF